MKMNEEHFDFVELAYEYPLCNPVPEKEDYFLLPVLIAKEMGMRAAIFTTRTPLTHQKREKVNGVDVLRFDSIGMMLKQLIKLKPKLVHGHSFGWIPATLAPPLVKRYVFTPHIYRLDVYPKFKVILVLGMLKKSDALIVLTRFEASLFQHTIDKSKIHVIPHPIDYGFFSQPANCEKRGALKQYGLKPTEKLILCVANLVPRKNLETLIRSFAIVKKEIPRSKLIIVGGDPKTILGVSTPMEAKWNYRSKLIELAQSLAVKEDVIFTGHQRGRELRGFYGAANVFCSPSRMEGQLLAAGEAASAGLPLVLSDLEPLVEIYQGCALFHKPMDYETLATHIINVLENPKLAKALGSAGRTKMQNYRPTIIQARLKRLYESLL
jgi:glycosyltransferase involved in cell wall biosynthesis